MWGDKDTEEEAEMCAWQLPHDTPQSSGAAPAAPAPPAPPAPAGFIRQGSSSNLATTMRCPSPPPPLLKSFSRSSSSGSLLGLNSSGRLTRVPQLLELYQQLRRSKLAAAGIRTGSSRGGLGGAGGGEGAPHVGCTAGVGGSKGAGNADSAKLFSQIMSKGSYATQVQSDVAAYGPALDKLAAAVAAFSPPDMDAVTAFVRQAQQQVLDQLYDETAVLKCIADWPAPKWDALWEATVMHKQLVGLQLQCTSCAEKQLAAASTSSTTTSTSSSNGGSVRGRKKGPSRATQLAAAASAAQQTFAAVSSKLEAYQRQEGALEKRLRAQGVPWNGPQLVAAVKEAAVQLGVVYVSASLALVRESEQQLQQAQQQLMGQEGGAGNTSTTSSSCLWGCAVRDPQQQQKLAKQLQRQHQQHQQKRKQQLDNSVTFLFKLHQFSGGFDEQGLEAFCGLAEEFQRQQQDPATPPLAGGGVGIVASATAVVVA